VNKPVVIAHRGWSAVAPENTLVSFRKALEMGAPTMECDVHLTRDGHVVVMHDPAVDRTTDGAGKIADMTLEDIRRLDAGSWKGPEYTGERVPLLSELLELTRGKTLLCLEIKAEGIAAQVVDVIRQADAIRDVAIISFSFDTCCEVRHLEPRLPVGFLCLGVEAGDDAAAWELTEKVLIGGLQAISALYKGVTPELRRATKARGLALWAWTMDDEESLRAMIDLGVDTITSNRLDLAMEVLASYGR
jgi:glycerophosphoryl diester phosphodiesterase